MLFGFRILSFVIKPAILIGILVSGFAGYAQKESLTSKQLRQQIAKTSNDTTLARLYGLLAWEIKFTHKEEAEQLADKEIIIANKYHDYLLLADGYRIKALILVIQEKLEKGMMLYDSSLVYAKRSGNLYYQASCYSLMGGMYGDHGDYHKAIEFYSHGLEIAQKSGDAAMIATLSNNLAESYQSDGRETDLARNYFQMALDNSMKIENWGLAFMNSSNLVVEYINHGLMEKAKEELSRSIEMLNRARKDDYQFATNSHVLASAFYSMGNMEEAEKYSISSLRIMDSLQRPDNAMRPLTVITNIYLKTKSISKAEKYANRMLTDAKFRNAKLYIRDGYKALSDIAKLKNKPEEALRYYELYKSWNDSVFKVAREQSISNVEARSRLAQQELEIKYETEKKEKEIELQKAKLIELDTKQKNLIIAASILLVLIFVSLLAYRSARLRKEKINLETTVDKRTKQLKEALSERELLIKEIHHRVKNNLQIISGLLEMKGNRTKDENIKKAIKESQNQVLSIAFIHQNLYQRDDMKEVEFGSFLRELIAHIKNVFDKPDKHIDVSFNIPELFFDIDTAVPLGLIINELLTNSYKYAFENKKDGKINIELKKEAEGEYLFVYADNGIGMPKDFDVKNSNTLGLKLITQLSRQLAGIMKYSDDNGSRFELNLKDLNTRNKMI